MREQDYGYRPREHDSSDCRVTYRDIDGCPTDCDCCCHSDDSGAYLNAEIGAPRR